MAIPKSVTPEWVVENQRATEVALSEDELQRLVAINRNFRLFWFRSFVRNTSKGFERSFDDEEDEKFKMKM